MLVCRHPGSLISAVISAIFTAPIKTNNMKETIVLIHGFGFDKRIWLPVELAFDSFEVIALSLPGFGVSPVDTPYSIAQLSEQYWQSLSSRQTEKVHLVGHSMGGYVCMEMAAQHPEKVASLCLVHSHVFADTPEKKEKRSATARDIRAHGRDALVRKMIPSFFDDSDASKRIAEVLINRGLSYNGNAWALGMEAMRDRADHSETLQNLDVPILMIMGGKDEAVPIELAYRQAALASRCKLVIYPESRHMAMYDHTGEMIRDLIAFYG